MRSGLLAGAGAGIVAAGASVLTRALLHAALPPLVPTIGSAFVAGLCGGLLYAWLTRMPAHPVPALWAVALVLATLESLLIATLAMPAGSTPRVLLPLAGLLVPVRQVAALLRLGQFSQRDFPSTYLLADTVTHYVTAVAVALLVPALVKRKSA